MKTNIQLTHEDHERSNIKFPLSIIANNITDPLNVGSLFRLSDALGIEKLYLCGDTPVPPNTKINKTSRSTEKYVEYESHADAEILITKLKKSGSFIISLEITSSSLAIDSKEFEKAMTDKPICLILGSENSGISEGLLSLSEMTVHIPMYGNNSSMNVISAASIACFEILRNM
ncbi:MAG: RNA methyltransferase [Gammaproteobacteria bacterium]|nr:MAG: RNA methyltransferase [Gammaproteobacteria bacterium]